MSACAGTSPSNCMMDVQEELPDLKGHLQELLKGIGLGVGSNSTS